MSVQRAHTILFVRDQAASTDFYASVLQQKPTLNVDGMSEFQLMPSTVLGLMPRSGAERLLGIGTGTAPRSELYVLVDDPGMYLERAIGAGATLLSPLQPRDWGDRAGYVQDLDGHIIGFAKAIDTPSAL